VEITSNALVPLSIKSNLVSTPKVRSPVQVMNKNISGKIKTNNKEFPVTYRAQALSYMRTYVPVGSTSLQSLIASEVAIS